MNRDATKAEQWNCISILYIDTHLYMPYHRAMATKSRPDACCTVPIIPVPLSATAEDRLLAGLKALADPTRLAIFRLIAAQEDPICVCDIVSRFDVSQPTISHHLKVLREAGLTTVSRRGVWAYYAVDQHGMLALRGLFGQVAPIVSNAA